MNPLILLTPNEILLQIAQKARLRRLALNLSQQTLSRKSGVSYGVIKKFEQTGRISFESLLKIALVLHSLNDFKDLFSMEQFEDTLSLDALIQSKPRQRGRK